MSKHGLYGEGHQITYLVYQLASWYINVQSCVYNDIFVVIYRTVRISKQMYR